MGIEDILTNMIPIIHPTGCIYYHNLTFPTIYYHIPIARTPAECLYYCKGRYGLIICELTSPTPTQRGGLVGRERTMSVTLSQLSDGTSQLLLNSHTLAIIDDIPIDFSDEEDSSLLIGCMGEAEANTTEVTEGLDETIEHTRPDTRITKFRQAYKISWISSLVK